MSIRRFTLITTTFTVPYQAGTLVARGMTDGEEDGNSTLKTAGTPTAIRLKAERPTVTANPNDLSYIHVEVVDQDGNVVPGIDDLEITYEVSGAASLAAVGNGNHRDMSSFQSGRKTVYHGIGMAIVRPEGLPGTFTLRARATGLVGDSLEVLME